MTEAQAATMIEILLRMEFLLHAASITLGLMFGLLTWIIVRDAMDRRTL